MATSLDFGLKKEQTSQSDPSSLDYGLDKTKSISTGLIKKDDKPTFMAKLIDFITAGHIPAQRDFPPEVEIDPITGEQRINVPGTAAKGFFEDPITWGAFGAGLGARTAGTLSTKFYRAAQELLGQATGGISDAPRIAKAGAEKIVSGVSAKNVEKTMEQAAEHAAKGIGGATTTAEPLVAGVRGVAAGERLPKYAGSINLEKQDIPTGAKQLEVELAKTRTKKAIPWEETEGRAVNTSIDEAYERLEKIKGGRLTADILAAREANAHVMTEYTKLFDAAATEKLSTEAFNSELKRLDDTLFWATSDASSEIGRALNIHKKVVSGEAILRNVKKLEKNLNERQIKLTRDILKKLETGTVAPENLEQFAKELPNPKLKEYVIEYWYNSILSGIPTHVVNVASNTAFQLYQLPHRAHVAMIDKLYSGFTGKARSRYINEVVPMMAGYKTGFTRGRHHAAEMMRTGKIAEFETKWAQEMGVQNIGAWGRSPNATIRAIAPYITVPTRALRAMDVWTNSMGYDAAINAIARREATKQGIEKGLRETFETTFKKTLPDWAHEEAMKAAKHNTFMDDPDDFTKAFIGLREKVPFGMGRFAVPFVNTISNLTKRGVELTPGLGILKEMASREMGRGNLPAEVIAKQIEGSILGMYILHKLDKGDITGSVPRSSAEREAWYRQNKMPWSIKVGDKWYQYRRVEPYNTPIASVAIAYEKMNNAKDDATKTQIFGEMARGLVDNLIDSSYFQGLQQVFNRHEKFQTAPLRYMASMVPYSSFWRSINRAYEQATEGQVTVKDSEDWLSAFAQVIPGLSHVAKTKLDVWGEEAVIPGSVFQQWLPYKWREEKLDATEQGLAKLERYPALPSQIVTIGKEKVKLPDELYRSMCIDFGNRAKTKLDIRFQSSVWQNALKDPAKHNTMLKAVDTILREERERARKKAIFEYRKGLIWGQE